MRSRRGVFKMKGRDDEILFPEEIYKHKDRDYTWEMHDMEIEDKIKELRKQIRHLQNCRQKQPKLVCFRKAGFGSGKMQCHIFHGFKIMDESQNLFCADSWSPITEIEADILKKKHNLTEEALKVIEETINRR